MPSPELQFKLATQLVVGTVARLSLHYDTPDLALPAGEVEARPQFGSRLEAGQTAVLTARVHNFGRSSLTVQGSTTDSLTASVTFWDGDPADDGAMIGEVQRKTFYPAGGIVELETTWSTAPGQEGFHDIVAVVEGLDPGYDAAEVSRVNNSSSLRVFLVGPLGSGPTLLAHHAIPNPVRSLQDGFQLYFELTRDASDVAVNVYDLAGDQVGIFRATGDVITDGNQAGANRVRASEFRWNAPALESGVYLYSIRCFDRDGALSDMGEGKLAVVR